MKCFCTLILENRYWCGQFSPSCTWSWSSVWSPTPSLAFSSGPAPEIQEIMPTSTSSHGSNLLKLFLTLFSRFSSSRFSWSSCSLAQASLRGISFSWKLIWSQRWTMIDWPHRPPGRQRQDDIHLLRNPNQSLLGQHRSLSSWFFWNVYEKYNLGSWSSPAPD